MKNIFYFLLFSYLGIQNSNAQQNKIHSTTNKEVNKDWLIDNTNYIAQITTTDKQILIENGLVRRSFMLNPNLACIDYTNLTTGQQLLRSIEPEAVVVIDNKTYAVGGLSGQKEKAYLNLDWEKNLYAKDADFYFTNYTISSIDSFVTYNPKTWMPDNYGAAL